MSTTLYVRRRLRASRRAERQIVFTNEQSSPHALDCPIEERGGSMGTSSVWVQAEAGVKVFHIGIGPCRAAPRRGPRAARARPVKAQAAERMRPDQQHLFSSRITFCLNPSTLIPTSNLARDIFSIYLSELQRANVSFCIRSQSCQLSWAGSAGWAERHNWKCRNGAINGRLTAWFTM